MTKPLPTFDDYTRRRLEQWGHEFALHRDCEYLGHVSKNMLQVLIDHKGEMPQRPTGFKPLEVDLKALQIERIITEMALLGMRPHACVMRAFYCGRGRKHVERFQTANELLHAAELRAMSPSQYRVAHDVGFNYVMGVLVGMSRAA